MIRLISTLAFAASLAGAAHAEQLVVQTAGKTLPAARAELYRAAESVCASPSVNNWDSACVEETYSDALQRLKATPAPRHAAFLRPIAFVQR